MDDNEINQLKEKLRAEMREEMEAEVQRRVKSEIDALESKPMEAEEARKFIARELNKLLWLKALATAAFLGISSWAGIIYLKQKAEDKATEIATAEATKQAAEQVAKALEQSNSSLERVKKSVETAQSGVDGLQQALGGARNELKSAQFDISSLASEYREFKGSEQNRVLEMALKVKGLDDNKLEIILHSQHLLEDVNKRLDDERTWAQKELNDRVSVGGRYRIVSDHDRGNWLYLEPNFIGGTLTNLKPYNSDNNQAWYFQPFK